MELSLFQWSPWPQSKQVLAFYNESLWMLKLWRILYAEWILNVEIFWILKETFDNSLFMLWKLGTAFSCDISSQIGASCVLIQRSYDTFGQHGRFRILHGYWWWMVVSQCSMHHPSIRFWSIIVYCSTCIAETIYQTAAYAVLHNKCPTFSLSHIEVL